MRSTNTEIKRGCMSSLREVRWCPNCYFESGKNVKGYLERMHWLWIERGDRDMTKQILRTQEQNYEKVAV